MQHASRISFENSHKHWAKREFAQANLGDARLTKRLQMLAADFSRGPGLSIPALSGNWARTKAAYRFFANPQVSAERILAAHCQATGERLMDLPLVLVAQDTTALNYSERPDTEGLGPIGNRAHAPLGLLAHVSLALTPEGRPIGLIDTKLWARSAKAHGQNHRRNARPLQEKESQRWIDFLEKTIGLAQAYPGTHFVNIADREGDLYEFFALALGCSNVSVLVRAQHDRRVRSPEGFFFATLSAQPSGGVLEIKVPRRLGQKARLAKLEIRFTAVTLEAPLMKSDQASLQLWAVEAREINGPAEHAITWRLLTTKATHSLEEAVQRVCWYAQRWQIEVFFRTLKTGCGVENHQLHAAKALQSVIMLDMIVACRVMALARAGREEPEALAINVLLPEECAILAAMEKTAIAPEKLTLRAAQRRIAQLGGFLARKGDGDPGALTLWRGLLRLHDMTLALLHVQNCG